MPLKTVSCIIPTYNGERYLREAILSVLRQTYKNLEIIIVDDGSTDNTAQCVLEFKSQVTLIRQAHLGVSEARNTGVRRSTGEFLTFLDADDLWLPTKIERQVAELTANCQLDFVVSLMQSFISPDSIEAMSFLSNGRPLESIAGFHPDCLLVRKGSFEKVGYFNPHMSLVEDIEWFVRAYENNLYYYVIPEMLVLHRLHNNSVTANKLQQSRQALLPMLHSHLIRTKFRQAQETK